MNAIGVVELISIARGYAAAVEAASTLAGDRGMLTEAVVIPAPAAGLAEFTI
ncbi:MAG: hypothetical protein ACOYES_12780 [Bacillota bacterium]|jgi:microcompartment protein CcmL/EutN